MKLIEAIRWWGWNWLFIVPLAFFGTAGILILTESWEIWSIAFIAALVFAATLPLWDDCL
jgi:hypothetical protein